MKAIRFLKALAVAIRWAIRESQREQMRDHRREMQADARRRYFADPEYRAKVLARHQARKNERPSTD